MNDTEKLTKVLNLVAEIYRLDYEFISLYQNITDERFRIAEKLRGILEIDGLPPDVQDFIDGLT